MTTAGKSAEMSSALRHWGRTTTSAGLRAAVNLAAKHIDELEAEVARLRAELEGAGATTQAEAAPPPAGLAKGDRVRWRPRFGGEEVGTFDGWARWAETFAVGERVARVTVGAGTQRLVVERLLSRAEA